MQDYMKLNDLAIKESKLTFNASYQQQWPVWRLTVPQCVQEEDIGKFCEGNSVVSEPQAYENLFSENL